MRAKRRHTDGMAIAVTLRPMSDDEYTTWRAVCVPDYAQGIAKTLRIDADVANERAAAQFEQMLPDGRGSAGNYLLIAEDDVDATRVGSLWLRFSPGDTDAFVADVVVDESLRGRGYGRATMVAAERFAGDLGATGLALHVFAENVGAVRLYEDLGYATTSQNMRKDICPPS